MNIEWNKVTWYSKVVAIILFVVVFYLGFYTGKIYEQVKLQIGPEETIATPTAPTGATQGSPVSSPKAATSAKTNTLSYTAAVNAYKDRRIQFDQNCVVTPNNPVFKNGTAVMLDNRSDQKLNIYLDRIQYSLYAYGFKIVTLKSAALPHTITIDCGSGRNNGAIVIE